MRKKKMKKATILALLAALLVLAGCAAGEPASGRGDPAWSPAPSPSPSPTPSPEPDSLPGTVRADVVLPVYTYLSRGDTLSVTGALEDYYVISLDGASMLVDRGFVRMDAEAPSEGWSGYAKSGAKIFDSAYLSGSPLAELELNSPIEVLEQLSGLAYVKSGDILGYMPLDMISETQIVYYPYDSGGGSSGSRDGGDIPLGFSGGGGGGIVLLSAGSSWVTWDNTSTQPAAATAFTDKLPVYLTELHRGDSVKVTDRGETEWSIFCNGKIGTVPAPLLRLDSDAPYSRWTGYAVYGAFVYTDYRLKGEEVSLGVNTALDVIDDLGSCYVVQLNGVTGYVAHDKVNESETSYSYSGGSGGYNGGGASTPEFTDDTM